MKMPSAAILAVLVVAGCAAGPGSGSGAVEQVRWHTLAEGRSMAADEGKPMVVDFFVGHGCSRCQKMVREVYSQPEIARKLNAEFVPIRIDLDRRLSAEEKALGEKFDYKEDCLLLFLTPAGEPVKGSAGQSLCFADFIDPSWFLQYLETARRQATGSP